MCLFPRRKINRFVNISVRNFHLGDNLKAGESDIFIFLLRISDKLDVNLVEAALAKIDINEQRYPKDLVRGSAKRASEYKAS